MSDNFKVELPSRGFTRIKIFDVNGKNVFDGPISLAEVILEIKTTLPPGLYSILLYKDKKVFHKKVVIH
jgi:hypothetical protein